MSAPDIETLVQLAEYFDVTTDVMLGKEKENAGSIAEQVKEALKGLDKTQAILNVFDISRSFVPAVFDVMYQENQVHRGENGERIQPYVSCFPPLRNCISNEDFYNLTVWSDDINLSVMLLRNKNNFAWLRDNGKKQEMAELFAFLADTDALSICRYIHSEQCSCDFTVQYMAARTGVPEEKTKDILDRAVEVGLCTREKAHLLSGEIDIYNSNGEGNILALIALAYEQVGPRDKRRYDFYQGNSCKMIKTAVNGGATNELV